MKEERIFLEAKIITNAQWWVHVRILSESITFCITARQMNHNHYLD